MKGVPVCRSTTRQAAAGGPGGLRAPVLALFAAVLTFVPPATSPAHAVAAPAPRATSNAAPWDATARGSGWPLLVIALDGLDWEWIERYAVGPETPNLRELVLRSARAVYNPLAGAREWVGAYLSAALGYRVEASEPATLGTGRLSRSVFERRTGIAPAVAEDAYFLQELPRLSMEARASGSFAPPGWLGEALRRSGVRAVLLADDAWEAPSDDGVAVGGASARTRRTSPLSLAGLLLMDTRGVVEPAHVVSVADPSSPGGMRTRWADLPRLLTNVVRSCVGCEGADDGRALALVSSGDLWRLLREGPEMAPSARERHHRALAARLDEFIEWWVGDPFWGKGSLLLFGASPPPGDGRDGRLLSAMVWRGPWEARGLYSATARRDAFVTAVDLAPTLAAMAGAPVPRGVIGRPVSLAGPAPDVPALREFARARAVIWAGRLRVMSVLITAQVLVLAAGLVLAAAGRLRPATWPGGYGRDPGVEGLLRPALAWAVAVPLVLLLPWVAAPPLAGLGGPAWAIAATAGGAALVAGAAVSGGRRLGLSATSVVGALTAGVLAADLLLRLDLVARSLMGFDLIGGARFYGIGNEHAGLLIGSSLVAAAEAGERWPGARGPITVTLLGLSWLVASPAFGSNVGGSLAAAAAFGACAAGWHVAYRPQLKAAVGRAVVGAAVALAVLGAAALQDLSASAARHSHLAMTVEATRQVGSSYVLAVAARKLALNWRLLRFSLYSRIMFVAMLVVMAAFWAPRGGLLRAMERRPRFRVALEASALGAAVALVANDSGVTAAAGALLAPAAWVLEMALGASSSGAESSVGTRSEQGPPPAAGPSPA